MLTEHGCQIAPSTYYAYRSPTPAARTITDAVVVNELRKLRQDANGRATPESSYGYRKTFTALGETHLLRVMRILPRVSKGMFLGRASCGRAAFNGGALCRRTLLDVSGRM
ncbi:hypothetical protein [Georgenia sp. AZ-5]|uniref:hypothetical protein n=1 Tax=Georgenia sp. AZ-5 TaxID=3367526 RepID=UPI0037550C06